MKKKIAAITMSLLFIVSLAGCGNKTTGNGTPVTGGADIPDNSNVVDIEETEETEEPEGTEGPEETEENSLKAYIQNPDGTWECEGITYKYKLEITGRMNNASCDSTFVYLSNIEEITFDQAWKAAGLSSDMNDYFDAENAVLVEWISEPGEESHTLGTEFKVIGGKSDERRYTSNVAFANWSEDIRLYTSALNRKMMTISSVKHLPVFKFNTVAELDEFKTLYSDILTMNQGLDEIPSFDEITATYNDSFFSRYTLLLAYVPASSSSYRFGVRDVYCDEQSFCLYIDKFNNPEVYDCMMAGWFVVVEVDKEDIADCTDFDAQLISAPSVISTSSNPDYPATIMVNEISTTQPTK